MTRTGQLAGIGVAAAALLAAAPAARAEDLGFGWEGRFTDDRIEDGYEATGPDLTIPVTFEYSGPPGSVITELTLELEPIADGCDGRSYTQPLDSGSYDDPPEGTTPTTVAPTQPTNPERTASVDWTFRVDPGCNGVYDIAVTGTADPPGSVEPGDPGTESGPLVVEGVRVSLTGEGPTGVTAEQDAGRLVTVRWHAPQSWSDGAPSDAIGFRVQRTASDGTPVVVADELAVGTTSLVDDDLVAAPAGSYRYHVVALRKGASGEPIASEAGETSVQLAPAPTPTTAGVVARSGSGARVGGTVRVGQPAISPPPEFDPGFDPELDYSDAELGDEQAVPPADAGRFEVSEDPDLSASLLVPGAVALCLAVWAGHLRHLARRAAPPAA